MKSQQAEMHRQNFIPAGQPVSFSQRWNIAGVRGTSKMNANFLLLPLLRLFMILSLKGRFFKTNNSFDLSQFVQLL